MEEKFVILTFALWLTSSADGLVVTNNAQMAQFYSQENYAAARRFSGEPNSSGDEKFIHLAGIFPINGVDGWQGGQACEPAAQLALADVNANPHLLPGYKLKMHWNDSGCDAGKGARVLYDLLYNQPQKVLLLAGCSTVCTTVAEGSKLWNLVTVCYGASSPALSNRLRFPTLFRTHPSATVHNPTRIKIFKLFGWTRVSIIQEAEEVFSTTSEDLELRGKDENIQIYTRQSFLRDPKAAVANLKRQDARIIVGLFYAKAARKVLCEIFKQKLYGPKYVWFFIGWYEDDWFRNKVHLKEENINCTAEEMSRAAEGHFTTEAQQWNQEKSSPTISGKTVSDFANQLREQLRDNPRYAANIMRGIMPEGYLEAPLAYDAIWAVALALNKTMKRLAAQGQTLEDYNYKNPEIMEKILEDLGDVKFDGVSGAVAFNEDTGDRIAWTKIEQLQEGRYEIVAYYDQKTDNLTWIQPRYGNVPNKVVWLGGKVPQDRTIIREVLMVVSLWIYILMVIIVFIGCVFAILLIYFNFKYGHRRIVQHSHPSCNNLMLLGIMLCLFAIIPGGLDGQFVSPATFPIACNLATWLLTLGFSLSFGAMFSKIWRVHRITRMTKEEGKAVAKVIPWKLWAAVAGLVCIDLVLLIIWALIDPLKREVKNFAKESSQVEGEDVEIVPQLEHCKSTHHNVWLGIMYAYKGLQLVLGLFLAYETRSQKVKQINDSRLVGMAIYNVIILVGITAPVMLVIGDQQNAAFCFVSMANIFCCFLSMALVFVPKLVFIRKHAHDPREKEEDARYIEEQEKEYKEILKENENLQKRLKEREDHLSAIRKRNAALHAANLHLNGHHSGMDASARSPAIVKPFEVNHTLANSRFNSNQMSQPINNNNTTNMVVKTKPSTVSFSNTRTTVTINEEPSTTTDASPTSTSPTPTSGPSSSPPPYSSSGAGSQAERSPPCRTTTDDLDLRTPVRPAVVKFSEPCSNNSRPVIHGQGEIYEVDHLHGVTIYKGHITSRSDIHSDKQFESYL